jgi:hypothetical protein
MATPAMLYLMKKDTMRWQDKIGPRPCGNASDWRSEARISPD